jgi:hypothetical protein
VDGANPFAGLVAGKSNMLYRLVLRSRDASEAENARTASDVQALRGRQACQITRDKGVLRLSVPSAITSSPLKSDPMQRIDTHQRLRGNRFMISSNATSSPPASSWLNFRIARHSGTTFVLSITFPAELPG